MQLRKLNERLLGVAAAVALVLGTSGAGAATETSNLSVTATVTANCSISTAPVAFGAYDPVVVNASADRDATGTVTVACTSGASAAVTLGQGANADTGSTDDVPLRRMTDDGTNFIEYGLFTDVGRATVWGNDTDTDVAHTGTGAAVGLTVYGRIPAGQNVPAGSYTDTVVATVTF
jgi:spore coat protein U-like protein